MPFLLAWYITTCFPLHGGHDTEQLLVLSYQISQTVLCESSILISMQLIGTIHPEFFYKKRVLKTFYFSHRTLSQKIAVTTSNEPFCASSDYHFSCFLHFLMHFIFDFLLCTELLLMFQWTPNRWHIDVIFTVYLFRELF